MTTPKVILRDPRAATDILLGHKKVSIAPDVGTPETIMVSDWNDRHIFAGGSNGDILTKDSLDSNGAKWTSPVAVTGPIPPIDSQYLLLQADPRLPNSAQFVTGPGIGHVGGTISLSDNGVSNAKLRDSGPLSVIGRSVNAPGDPADITAFATGYVLKRTGDALDFRYLDINETVGQLPTSRISGGASLTLPGVASTAWFAMINNNNYLYGANTGGGWVGLIGMDSANRVHISPNGAHTLINSNLEVPGYCWLNNSVAIGIDLSVGRNIAVGGLIDVAASRGVVKALTCARAWGIWTTGWWNQYGFASGQLITTGHYRLTLNEGLPVPVPVAVPHHNGPVFCMVQVLNASQFDILIRTHEGAPFTSGFSVVVFG